MVVGPTSGGAPPAMLAPLRSAFVPNRVVSVVTPGRRPGGPRELVPLVAGKRARQGQATAYVCENRVCDFPTSDPAVIARQIRSVRKVE
ncbi:MAG: hypothetical protein OEM05_16190 [Myxococcales bacterium]|nr:hypothetical protein [Myxococcales bacterium]